MDSTDFGVASSLPSLTFIRKTGAQFAEVFTELARLRIQVFRAFPYLYAGSFEYEKAYLQTYANASRSFLFAVYDGSQMVGATTGIPLIDETAAVKNPFLAAGYDLSSIYYFGESILLPAYRGHGLGHRFFAEREAYATGFGAYKQTCFCAVSRPDSHPLRPAHYQPLEAFWTGRGYQKEPRLQSKFEWLDIGENQPTAKPMVYWLRDIRRDK